MSLWMPWSNGGPSIYPWLNVRLGVSYTLYNQFNGASSNYNGAFRNASDNNTTFLYAWWAFYAAPKVKIGGSSGDLCNYFVGVRPHTRHWSCARIVGSPCLPYAPLPRSPRDPPGQDTIL